MFLVLALCASLFDSSFARDRDFPTSPDRQLTPGSYCHHPDAFRYREKVPYCNRDVSSDEKMVVIANYNQKLGYSIERKERPQFKIDHLIPLCAGGSNQMDNLWPQHESVYKKTDIIESMVCEKMAKGVLLQKRAVELIFEAKFNLNRVDDVIETLNRM